MSLVSNRTQSQCRRRGLVPGRSAAWNGAPSRAALLASASLIALSALAAPDAAWACSGANLTISTAVAGPILSTGGSITVTTRGAVDGGPTGVWAQNCGVGTLRNSGAIAGAIGASGAPGGIGVLNSGQTIDLLSNAAGATISGGSGGGGNSGGAGGAALSNAGVLTTLKNSGLIRGGEGRSSGGTGGAGLSNAGTITTLNNRGTISGGGGGRGTYFSGGSNGGAGGAGVSNAATITTLRNIGAIRGGGGGSGGTGGAGGAGLSNAGTITTLSNKGTIGGGNGGLASPYGGGAGGAGLSNAGTLTKLSNSGAITGGSGTGGGDYGDGGAGGAGLSNASDATIASLHNATGGTILGGSGGLGGPYGSGGTGGAGIGNSGTIATLSNGGTIRGGSGGGGGTSGFGGIGGAGVRNSGQVKTLTNSGSITGGNGGSGSGLGGPGNAGIANFGTVATLANSGTIQGGAGGNATSAGPPGRAIDSTGANASIGRIANSGSIIGNVEIDNQRSLSVTGGTAKIFGEWTGGTITIGNGSLIFAGGKTALGDDVVVDGGAGKVTNEGVLRLAATQSISGEFAQTGTGVLDFKAEGDDSGLYGSLMVSGEATLAGRLGLELTHRFTPAVGDSFNFLDYNASSGDFSGFSLDGVACESTSSDVWSCYNLPGYLFQEVFDPHAFDLDVLAASATTLAGSSAVPEPSTWALLAAGFLSLAGLRFVGRPARQRA